MLCRDLRAMKRLRVLSLVVSSAHVKVEVGSLGADDGEIRLPVSQTQDEMSEQAAREKGRGRIRGTGEWKGGEMSWMRLC